MKKVEKNKTKGASPAGNTVAASHYTVRQSDSGYPV